MKKINSEMTKLNLVLLNFRHKKSRKKKQIEFGIII
jgi:hypothetical protein